MYNYFKDKKRANQRKNRESHARKTPEGYMTIVDYATEHDFEPFTIRYWVKHRGLPHIMSEGKYFIKIGTPPIANYKKKTRKRS